MGTRFGQFESCIKRYAWVGGTFTDVAIKEIENETGIKFDDLEDESSFAHHAFRHSKVFDHGNYNSEDILLLGFLSCYHLSDEKAADSLWGIVNPNLDDTVSKDRIT